jgi:dephospho-CoA kinase
MGGIDLMWIIGLTGGIGSGKSTVARRLASLGAPVIDADLLARELVAPGQPALAEIVQAFGPEIVTASGALDRPTLRQRIFSHPTERRRLESILHPRIRTAMQAQLRTFDVPYAVLMIPLLLETGQQNMCHRVLVVDVPEWLQIERVSRRDGHTIEDVRAVLRTQCSREQRLAAADDLIDNSKDLAHLIAQTDALHQQYLSLARSHDALQEILPLRRMVKY